MIIFRLIYRCFITIIYNGNCSPFIAPVDVQLDCDVYPVIYGFDKSVPVNIYDGNLKIDFTNIAKWFKDGME